MRQTKHTKGSILIICEGRNTEPLFYGSIKDLIIEGHYDIGIDGRCIEIRPEPKEKDTEEEDAEEDDTKYKGSKRKRRQKRILRTIDQEPEADIPGVPPLKWVVAGKKELEDGTYDEVWVVCDNDNHPAREEAFDEANKEINGKKVNIAYSSIAFEYYILLHFERIYKAFEKSECRQGKETIGCMTEGITGCEGDKCINGYLRKQEYITDSTKARKSVFPIVKDKLETGFENAAWLRYKSEIEEGDKPIWDRNPYVNTDKLTLRLIGNENKYFWIDTNHEQDIDGFHFTLNEEGLLVKNNKGNTEILKADCLIKINSNGENINIGSRQVLFPGEDFLFTIEKESGDWFKFVYQNNIILFN